MGEVEKIEAARLLDQLLTEEAELEAQLNDVRAKRNDAESFLLGVLGAGEAVPIADGRVAVKAPGPAPKARINTTGVEAAREQLAAVGLVTHETRWTNPTVTELRKEVARLAAVGLNLDDLITTPDAPLRVTVVTL